MSGERSTIGKAWPGACGLFLGNDYIDFVSDAQNVIGTLPVGMHTYQDLLLSPSTSSSPTPTLPAPPLSLSTQGITGSP